MAFNDGIKFTKALGKDDIKIINTTSMMENYYRNNCNVEYINYDLF